jgi:hypothetical protein
MGLQQKLTLTCATVEKSSYEEEEELVRFFESHLEGAVFFHHALRPYDPYERFDWYAVVPWRGSALPLGEVLWAAYRRVLEARGPGRNPSLVFQLRDRHRHFMQMVLDDQFSTEAEFLKEFQHQLDTSFNDVTKTSGRDILNH